MRRKCAVEPTRPLSFARLAIANQVRTLVPAKGTFGLECLPKTIYRVLVQKADVSAVWHHFRRLVIHSSQRLKAGVSGASRYQNNERGVRYLPAA